MRRERLGVPHPVTTANEAGPRYSGKARKSGPFRVSGALLLAGDPLPGREGNDASVGRLGQSSPPALLVGTTS